MSRIEELELRISEMLAADAGAEETFCPIKDLVKEYEKALNRAIEIRRDNLAYVIIATKYFLGILESLDKNLTFAAQCLYRAFEIDKIVQAAVMDVLREVGARPVSMKMREVRPDGDRK